MWVGETVYFLSDRDGEFNLYSYDRGVEEGRRAHPTTTTSRSRPPRPATGKVDLRAGRLDLHVFDPARAESHRLKIGVAADLAETRPRFASGAKYIRDADISPTRQAGRARVSAARSSPSRPRRATPQPHPDARRRTSARRPGRPTASRSPTSPTPRASTPCTSGRRTARARPKSYPLKGAGLLRAARRGRPTARRSPSSTTRGRSTGSTSALGQGQAGRRRAGLRARSTR